jgi:hypothetical protein
MPLLGDAALIIWNGIRDETRRDFFAWHNREHILERVSIPGFRRGRRYIAIDAEPEFFNLYEVDRFETLVAGAYPERLARPTPWTERVMPGFVDMNRSLSRVVLSKGLGSGGILATIRFDPAGALSEVVAGLSDAADTALVSHPEILAFHVCIADLAASSVETAERRARGAPTRVPAAAVLVEGTDPGVLTRFSASNLSQASFQRMGLSTPVTLGLYRLEISLTRDERPV